MALTWHGDSVKAKIKSESKRRVTIAAEDLRGALLETLSGNRSGRQYKIPGTGSWYTASAPGEPPASRLGRLRQSIHSVVSEKGDGAEAEVGTDFDYGLYLERGTSKMAPRPWMKPTIEREKSNLENTLGGKWTL